MTAWLRRMAERELLRRFKSQDYPKDAVMAFANLGRSGIAETTTKLSPMAMIVTTLGSWPRFRRASRWSGLRPAITSSSKAGF
jgi:hypothetical protein